MGRRLSATTANQGKLRCRYQRQDAQTIGQLRSKPPRRSRSALARTLAALALAALTRCASAPDRAPLQAAATPAAVQLDDDLAEADAGPQQCNVRALAADAELPCSGPSAPDTPESPAQQPARAEAGAEAEQAKPPRRPATPEATRVARSRERRSSARGERADVGASSMQVRATTRADAGSHDDALREVAEGDSDDPLFGLEGLH